MGNRRDSVTYAANSIYQDNPDLIRLYKVYHPSYELKVNVEKKNEAPTYHVIQRYMDKILCSGEFTEEEICSLLGLNRQAYEVSRLFFQDLIKNGHCVEVEGTNPPHYRGTPLAKDSTRDQKMYIPGEDLVSKLFDQYTLHLLPGEFYEMGRLEKTVETITKDEKKAVWLPKRIYSTEGVISEETAIGQMIGNHSYSNEEQLNEYALPVGYRGMHLASSGNENPEILYFPYYLGVLKDKETGEKYYRAFRIDNKRVIPWIGEQYLTSAYADARELIKYLSSVQELEIQSPLSNSVINENGKKVQDPEYRRYNLKENGRVLSENGISLDEDGNYVWSVRNDQIAAMTGGNGLKRDLRLCRKVAYNDVVCLERFEAGKLIHIVKNEEQKQYLLGILEEKKQ